VIKFTQADLSRGKKEASQKEKCSRLTSPSESFQEKMSLEEGEKDGSEKV